MHLDNEDDIKVLLGRLNLISQFFYIGFKGPKIRSKESEAVKACEHSSSIEKEVVILESYCKKCVDCL